LNKKIELNFVFSIALKMDNLQIIRAVGGIPSIKNFEGALPIDLVTNDSIRRPRSVIINLDESDESGSHWVALFVDNFGNASYYDSFADEIPYVLRTKFAIKERSTEPTQTIFSDACGFYCILFLFLKNRGYTLSFIQRILKRLSDSRVENIVKTL
jgi:hypothetical protein